MSAGIPPSTLFTVLRSLAAGRYVETAPAGAQPSRLVQEFAQANWEGVQLALDDSGAGIDLDTLLARAGVTQAQWMTVRGETAVRALAGWQGTACRPLAVLVETGPLALPATGAQEEAPAAWRAALQRSGYLFAISDDGYHHFVRSDQAGLHAQLAEHASLAWRARLQAGRNALAQAQREAEQARSALRMAQAKGMAAEARATMLEQQIGAIHASSSWRLTKALRWSARLRQEPGPALHQLRAVLRLRLAALLRKPLAPLPDPSAPALPPAIDPNNMIGPQFKTLLLEELGRGSPPASGQG